MEKLLSSIINYIDYVTESKRFYVSIHFAENRYELFDPGVVSVLAPYMSHNNPYCMLVRADSGRYVSCIHNQKEIIRMLAECDVLEHSCYASAREVVYPIRLNGAVCGFATVSGYKGDGKCRIDDALWEQALRPEIPRRDTDALMPPLCNMLETLLSTMTGSKSSEESRILAYVSENRATVTLDSVAEHFGRSRSHISHMFKRMTGKSIRAYSSELKLFTAERLLLGTQMSVTEIAFEVGFGDTSYFIRLFREKYGISPERYRQRENK